MSSAASPSDDLPEPRYARFSRRLKGMFIDWTITLVVIFGALIIATSARNDNISRVLGAVVVLVVALYEPLLVSRTGSTVGHHLTNLRVVDNGHGGNVGFLKAVARSVIKGVLGWFSFILMAATRRNQAIHDFLTRSTVQIRDTALATSDQFVTERIELAHPDMPPPLRRIAVIIGYLALTFGVYVAVGIALGQGGLVSARCVDADICSRAERLTLSVFGLALLAIPAVLIVLGWKARLPGARRG